MRTRQSGTASRGGSRHPANYIDDAVRKSIAALKTSREYKDCSFSEFQKKLCTREGIKVSYSTLRRIIKESNIPPVRKYTVNYAAKHKQTAKNFGELVYIFAVTAPFFGKKKKYTLHIISDEAQNMITGLCLCEKECLDGYSTAFKQTRKYYGLPISVYCNKHQNNSLKQFAKHAEKLGIEIVPVQSYAGKNQVKRLCELLRERLTAHLAENDIHDIDAANIELSLFKMFFNKEFSVSDGVEGYVFVPEDYYPEAWRNYQKKQRSADGDKTMIWSIRNFLFKSEKFGWLLYAGNSGSMMSVSEETARRIPQFIKGKFGKLSTETFDIFKKYGVILDKTDDELLEIIMTKTMKAKFSSAVFSLSLCPTNACNFVCPYCFENADFKEQSEDKYITPKTIANLIEHIKQSRCKKIIVTLFGGEPLLRIDSIFEFDAALKTLDIEIEYSMITNGYLLTLETLKKLEALPVKRYQITIDGFEAYHNKSRPHRSGINDSYSKIIDNLTALDAHYRNAAVKPEVHIRVNIDRTNKDCYSKFYAWCKEYFSGNVKVYSAFVYGKRENNPAILSVNEQAKFMLDNYYRYGIYERSLNLESRFKFNSCMADITNSLVVDSDGNAYKCQCDLGRETRCLFNVNAEKKLDSLVEARYLLTTSPFIDQNCRSCFLLFSCMGGCPEKRVSGNKVCSLVKHKSIQFLEMYYDYLNKRSCAGS